MQKFIVPFLLCFFSTNLFGQTNKKTSTYLLTQFNTTLHDVTKGNNPWGVGLGLQTLFNNRTMFKPAIELTGDIYLKDDKVLRTDSAGTPLKTVRGMVNLFIGTSFNPTKKIYLSVLVGPSFVSGQTLLGIKPSVGFYFTKSQKWTGKFSYINIFNRGNVIKENFSSLSLSVGLKLF